MTPNLTEEDLDDIIYFARTGDADFTETCTALCIREKCTFSDLLLVAQDPESGNGPLHMAAANNHAGILTSSITSLAIPTPQNPIQLSILNAKNKAGNTPLHWAALNGHLECVKVLVDAGADPTITNNAGHDPIYEAELNDRREVVEWVLKEGGEGLEQGLGGGVDGETDEVADTEEDNEEIENEHEVMDLHQMEREMKDLKTDDKSS